MKDNDYRLVNDYMVDSLDFPMSLPCPNNQESGGYFLPTANGNVPCYSSIDLLVAGLTSMQLEQKIYNLKKWFMTNPNRPIEHKLTLSFILPKVDDTTTAKVETKSIALWKLDNNKRINEIMSINAPFTWRY